MIDAHCHILPGVDDGAKTIEESIAMAEQAALQGIDTITATPHFIPGEKSASKGEVLAKTAELNDELQKRKIKVNIVPAMEVYFTEEIPDLLERDTILTINDNKKFLLVELPLNEAPIYTEEILFNIAIKGVTPIIAHPERNLTIQRKPEWAKNLVEQGVLLQLNAGSLLGYFGPKAQSAAKQLLKMGIVHILGSDAHAPSGRRAMSMGDALNNIRTTFNDEYLNTISTFNPSQVIKGVEIESICPFERAPKNFAGWLLFKVKKSVMSLIK